MNAAHLHLLVSHLPVVGAFLALALLALAAMMKLDRGVLTSAVLVLCLSAGGAGVALRSGAEARQHHAQELDAAASAALDAHEERAKIAALLLVFSVGLGIGTLWWAERRGQPALLPVAALAASAVVAAAAMAWAAAPGSQIRHPAARPVTPGGAMAAQDLPGDAAKGD